VAFFTFFDVAGLSPVAWVTEDADAILGLGWDCDLLSQQGVLGHERGARAERVA
jgi:hypothetical protein